MKHNPAILVRLAEKFEERAQVVVVSQGAGAAWLTQAIETHNLTNLVVLPYQDSDQLPAMYSSAEVLLVLLTDDAGQFSVPSKILTYLCAKRPVLAGYTRGKSCCTYPRSIRGRFRHCAQRPHRFYPESRGST